MVSQTEFSALWTNGSTLIGAAQCVKLVEEACWVITWQPLWVWNMLKNSLKHIVDVVCVCVCVYKLFNQVMRVHDTKTLIRHATCHLTKLNTQMPVQVPNLKLTLKMLPKVSNKPQSDHFHDVVTFHWQNSTLTNQESKCQVWYFDMSENLMGKTRLISKIKLERLTKVPASHETLIFLCEHVVNLHGA